jgi:phospho-N-acetylmuramoyl-pentapeptide-transferase
MLQALLYPLHELFSVLNVFKYITFRAAAAAICAFAISVLFGSKLIRALKQLKLNHSPERVGFESIASQHAHKTHVPTMGGLLMVGSMVVSVLLWGDLSNRYLWIALLSTVWLGAIGFADDYLKIKNHSADGLSAITKFSGQALLAIGVGLYLYQDASFWTAVSIPFLKDVTVHLGIGYVLFAFVVLVGTSNAVNLTDGLDGLATGCALFAALAYAVFSYVTGHVFFAKYLFLPFIDGAGELTVFCGAMIGACLGFLWFNSQPATVFMGDTGSLALGGAIGIVALLIKQEMILLVVGGVFVMEALSVILQVGSFKLTGKRIFLMAPIHHHFQKMGWPESKVVIRFWILAVILLLAGLSSLKLR